MKFRITGSKSLALAAALVVGACSSQQQDQEEFGQQEQGEGEEGEQNAENQGENEDENFAENDENFENNNEEFAENNDFGNNEEFAENNDSNLNEEVVSSEDALGGNEGFGNEGFGNEGFGNEGFGNETNEFAGVNDVANAVNEVAEEIPVDNFGTNVANSQDGLVEQGGALAAPTDASGRTVRYAIQDDIPVYSAPDPASGTVTSLAQGQAIVVAMQGDWAELAPGQYVAANALSEVAVPRSKTFNEWR